MSPKLRVRLISKAAGELQRAAIWYEEQGKGLGSSFMLSAEAALAMIQRNPELYSKIEGDTRRVVMKHFPYGIFYSIEVGEIVITAVFHSRRNPTDR